MDTRSLCIWNETMQGDGKGVNPSLENTTILGRVISGDFEGQSSEFFVFFEFFELEGAYGRVTTEQEQCFREVVNSVVFTAPTATSRELTIAEEDIIRAMIDEEQEKSSALFLPGSEFWNSIYLDQRGATYTLSMRDVSIGYQKGMRLTLNGDYIRSYEDFKEDPEGLRAYVHDLTNNVDPIHQDLKHAFPLNGTSKLADFFVPMMSHGFGDISFKVKKDGSGIFPLFFLEHFLYCVNASALENWRDPYEQYEQESQSEGVDLDVLVSPPPAVEVLGGRQDLDNAEDAPTSGDDFLLGVRFIIMPILVLIIL